MNDSIYIVQRGDSLSKIARAHGTSPQALASINGITNVDVIRVGQKLKLSEPAPSARTPEPQETPEDDAQGTLWIQFVDALNRPIRDLKAAVHAGTETLEHLSDQAGYLPRIDAVKAGSAVKVIVDKVVGGTTTVAEFISGRGHQHVLLISPKTTVQSTQRVHEGPPRTPAAPTPQPPGTVTETRSPNGNPVQQIALECPNSDNLRLDANFKYRDIILAAGKRSGYKPQAIAAIMNAEAATITTVDVMPVLGKDGKPVLDKKTNQPKVRKRVTSTGEWNEKSASPRSSARGMTQFLDGSWIDQALTDGTYLNAKAKSEGWLTTQSVTKGQKTITVNAFKNADGTLVTPAAKRSLANVLSTRPHLTGRATANDANLQALLDLRFTAEYAIHTAVDYGIQNMKALSNDGYKLDSLNDGEKAKLVYLCHHLGLVDSKHFIDNTISESHAKYLLEHQVGEEGAAAKAKNEKGSYLQAHRQWLAGYIRDKVKLITFECQKISTSNIKEIIEICSTIQRKIS